MKGDILQGSFGENADYAGHGRRYVRRNERMQERRDAARRIFKEVSQNKKRGLE